MNRVPTNSTTILVPTNLTTILLVSLETDKITFQASKAWIVTIECVFSNLIYKVPHQLQIQAIPISTQILRESCHESELDMPSDGKKMS